MTDFLCCTTAIISRERAAPRDGSDDGGRTFVPAISTVQRARVARIG